ncbi:hypothetical protein, partial [Candidatus Hakubella thermalkaliphila]|uniref:hypothetical protein n=1 Tax=Candidatus Hakubella thermalkaliphila TaxID=2754717 RepID=UPI001C616993
GRSAGSNFMQNARVTTTWGGGWLPRHKRGQIGRLAFSIAERWCIEMQILRTARRLHDPGQTLTARGPVPDERH